MALAVFKSTERYGGLNSFDALKLLALFTMIVDHVGDYLLPHEMWLRAIGRMAFPLFLFLVGYSGVWRIKFDLFFWALLVALTGALTHHAVFPLNVLATIAITRVLMRWLTRTPLDANRLRGIFSVSILLCLHTAFIVDYGTFALLFAVCGYLHRHKPEAQSTRICLVVTLVLHFYIQSALFHFSPAVFAGAAVVGVLTGLIMWHFTLRPIDVRALGMPVQRALQWAARNTLPLYGLHVMLLMLAERVFFPERLLHFHWIY